MDEAHSVRGASASAALRKGVSIGDVLSTADWTRESTFRRFYYRDALMLRKVLQGDSSNVSW